MEQTGPKETTVDFVETTNSLRPQYSVEIIDPETLKLWVHQLGILGEVEAANRFKARNKLLSKEANKVQPPLDKFTLFPFLPVELRIKIWKLTMLPRLVMNYSGNNICAPSKPFFTPAVPVMMHMSVEAREVVVENVAIFFEANSPDPQRNNFFSRLFRPKSKFREISSPTILNFELDTLLCLSWDGESIAPSDPSRLPPQIYRQVRHMSVSSIYLKDALFRGDFRLDRDSVGDVLYDHMTLFENLKTISIFGPVKGPPKHEPWRVDIYERSLKPHAAGEWNLFVWDWIFREMALAHLEWKVEVSFVRVKFRAPFPKN